MKKLGIYIYKLYSLDSQLMIGWYFSFHPVVNGDFIFTKFFKKTIDRDKRIVLKKSKFKTLVTVDNHYKHTLFISMIDYNKANQIIVKEENK